jgi:hypothetical protein
MTPPEEGLNAYTCIVAEAEQPERRGRKVTVADIHQLMGASTPHFALQLRNRIQKLIAGLHADDPARIEGEREIARLTEIAFTGETRGPAEEGEQALPSLNEDAPVRNLP